jgi:hypothetical protein
LHPRAIPTFSKKINLAKPSFASDVRRLKIHSLLRRSTTDTGGKKMDATRTNNHIIVTTVPPIAATTQMIGPVLPPNNGGSQDDVVVANPFANDDGPWWGFLQEAHHKLVDFYIEDTVSFVFICALVVTGLLCGVIMMPVFLTAATSDIYPDVCDVKSCSNNDRATIYARGFRYTGLMTTPTPCSDMVGWTGADCFLRPSKRNATFEVYLSRPHFITGVYVGAIGWAALIALTIWFVLCLCKKAMKRGLAYVKPRIYCALVVLFLYAMCASASAVLLLVWGRVGLATTDCIVTSCNQSHYATLYSSITNATTVTYTSGDCSAQVGKSYSSCYYNAKHGYLLGHVPALTSVIGLTSSSCAALVICIVTYFSFHVAYKRGLASTGNSAVAAQAVAQP